VGLFDWLPWRRKSNRGQGQNHSSVQTRSGGAHPFDALRSYVPNQVEVKLYRQMRDGIPIIGVGIQNLRRLIGSPKIRFGAPNSRRQKEWDNWAKGVKVGKVGKGFNVFVSSFVDSLLQNGFSAAEIVPYRSRSDIYALLPISGEVVVVKSTEDPTEFILAEHQQMEPEPVPYPIQDWIVYSAYEAEPENPYGKGLLTGLPFLADILLTVFYATGRNWERFGDLKYSLEFNFPDGVAPKDAQEFIDKTKKSWTEAMSKTRAGKVQDFFGTYVKVSVVGADAKQLDMEIPVRNILEQIVAKTGLPPFVFGFSWSSRESMSKTQADILTSLIDDWREMITPAIVHIIDWWCRFRGYPLDYEIVWDEVSLADIEGMANAELTNARAEGQRLQNIMIARDLEEQGYIEPEVVQSMIEARKKKRGGKTFKRATKDSDGDIDPERLPQKDRDTRKIDRIGGTFERQTTGELKKVRQRLFQFMDSRVEKSAVQKSIDIEDIRQVVEEEINAFVAATIGETAAYSSFYDVLIRAAALAGFESAVEDIRRDLNEDATVRSQFDFSTEYVRQLRTQGMDIVTTEAKNLKDVCRDIMERHATVGDNPERWATSLQNELAGQLDEKRWYWRRLGRSEAAMMFDRAAEEEYALQGIEFVKWIIAPDACDVCRVHANKIFPLRGSPRTVFDTHPHCRCRKMAVTIDTAEEARQAGVLEYFDRTNTPRKGVKNHGEDTHPQKHGSEGDCGRRH